MNDTTTTSIPIEKPDQIPDSQGETPTLPTKGIRLSPLEIKKTAEKNAAERELPKVPGRKIGDEDLTQWFNLLTPVMWNRLMIYVYRTFPVINRKLVDPDAFKYIDVLTREPFEMSGRSIREYLKNNHGGGYYSVTVNDVDSSANKTIIEASCKIPLDEAKPRLNYREVDFNESRNGSYIVMLQQDGIIDERKQIIANKVQNPTQQNQQGQGGSNQAETLTGITAMVERLAMLFGKLNEPQRKELEKGGINELFLEKLKQESPSTVMGIITPILTMLTQLVSKPPDTSNQISVKDLLLMMEANNQKNMDMMMLLMKKNENPPPQQEDWLDKIIKVKTVFPNMFGGGGGDSEPVHRSTAEIVMEGAKEFALPLLGVASQFMQMSKGVKPIVPVTEEQAREMANISHIQTPTGGHNLLEQARRQESLRPKVVTMEPPTQQTSNDNPNVGSGDSPNPSSDPTNNTLFSPIVANFIQGYGSMFVNALKSGTSGEVAGDQIKSNSFLFGQDVHAILKAQGIDSILYTMKVITPFWDMTGKMYGEVMIEEFLDRFLNFESFLGDDGDGTEPEGTKG